MLDRLIFILSKKNSTFWILKNKLCNLFYGVKKNICTKNIIIICGYPRSGTTLLKAILERHNQITSPGIEVFIFQQIKNIEILKLGFGINGSRFRKTLGKSKDLISFTTKILDSFMKKENKEILLLKFPEYIICINDVLKYFPNSKIIHIIRDGRDCTKSHHNNLSKQENKYLPYDWNCRQWVAYVNISKKFQKDPRYFEIRYENLVMQPSETVNIIMQFLHLETMNAESILNYYKYVDPLKLPAFSYKVTTPIDKYQINKWIHLMSDKEKKIFKKIANDTLIELGYVKDANW